MNDELLRRANEANKAIDQKNRGGLRGLLAGALPLIGGAVGSVGGTFLGGPVGTFAGGAAGSGFGEFLRQQVLGEEADLGTIGREALLGAVPGGLGLAAKGVKGLKAGAQAASAGAKATDVATDATKAYRPLQPNMNTPAFMRKGQTLPADNAVLNNTANRPGADVQKQLEGMFNNNQYGEAQKVINDIADPDLKAGMQSTLDALAPKPAGGLVGRVKSGAGTAQQEGFGLTVGQNKGGGRVLTPDDATRAQDFITTGSQKYGGIRAGKPIEQAKDAQGVLNNVTQQLDETLASINRPTTTEELTSLAGNISNRLAGNAMITKGTPTAQKLVAKIGEAPDLQTLEKIRREADNIAFTTSGAKKTSAAAQAKEVRDAIDEFITPLSPQYKAIKGDYTLARDALDSTSKANKAAKGFKIPFVDVEIGKQGLTGAKNKIASKIAGQGAQQTSKTGGFRPFVKPALQQAGTRVGASALLGTPFAGQMEPDVVTAYTPEETTLPGELNGAPAQPDRGQQLMEAAQKYLVETGDTEGAQTLMAMADQFTKMNGGAEKPLSAEAARSVSTAQAGLEAINLLGGEIAKDPSVQQKSVIPGNALGGAVGAVMGTGQYENARGQIKDVIARLRTGAAITAEEQKMFDSYVPQPFDSPEVVNQKLGILQRQFQRVASRSANATGVDPSEVLSGAL